MKILKVLSLFVALVLTGCGGSNWVQPTVNAMYVYETNPDLIETVKNLPFSDSDRAIILSSLATFEEEKDRFDEFLKSPAILASNPSLLSVSHSRVKIAYTAAHAVLEKNWSVIPQPTKASLEVIDGVLSQYNDEIESAITMATATGYLQTAAQVAVILGKS